jgi:hypothetical protein
MVRNKHQANKVSLNIPPVVNSSSGNILALAPYFNNDERNVAWSGFISSEISNARFTGQVLVRDLFGNAINQELHAKANGPTIPHLAGPIIDSTPEV